MPLDLQNSSPSSYLSFSVGSEIFAIPIHQIHEILELQRITKVPKTSKHILGVINRRGDILPVINTHSIFRMPNKTNMNNCEIMVMEIESGEKKVILGALIDTAKDVLEIKPEEITQIPEVGQTYDSHYFIGAKKTDDGFILIVDPNKVFAVEQFQN